MLTERVKEVPRKYWWIGKIYAVRIIKANFLTMDLYLFTQKWSKKQQLFRLWRCWIKKGLYINQSSLKKKQKLLIQRVWIAEEINLCTSILI